jgi:hypothetical protein
MEPEIIRVDKTYRKKLFTWYLVGIGLVTATIIGGVPFVGNAIKSMPFVQAYRVMEIIAIAFLFCFTPAAIYCIRLGHAIRRADAFPVPGMKVIHDTLVIRGVGARRRSRALIALGWLFIALLLIGAGALHWTYSRYISNPFGL